MNRSARVMATLMGLLGAGPLLAEADGPDFFRVTDVRTGSVLNIRTAPDTTAPVVGTLAAGTDGVANLGCIGGLSLQEFQEATEEARAAGRKTRWCLVGHDRQIGWAAGWFLGEGGLEDGFNAGGPLPGLEGSEWQLTRLGATEISLEATIGFRSEGTIDGLSGCNRMIGSFVQDRNLVELPPMGSTMMLCPDDQMELERAFLSALEQARRVAGRNLVMALLGEDNRVLAQFRRLDFD